MKIEYWSDYACPYCYIGITNMKTALARLGLLEETEITMKAFELNPGYEESEDASILELFATKYGLGLDQAQERLDSIRTMGEEAGLDMHYDTARKSNTFDAHRLTKYAEETGGRELANQMSEILYRAYFVDNQRLSDREVLLGLAEEAGLDPEKVRDMFSSQRFSKEVWEDEMIAHRNDVRSVPCFIVGKYMIPGAMPAEGFENVIERIIKEQE